MFLQVSAIHSVHRGEGVSLSACWDTTPWDQTPPSPWIRTPPDKADTPRPGRHSTPGSDTPPGSDPPDQTHPGPGRHPPDQTPPQTRQTPPLGPGRHPRWIRHTPPGQGRHPPGPGRHPPGPGRPPQTRETPHPPGKQTPAYGLRAAGTHPTGMHSCLLLFSSWDFRQDTGDLAIDCVHSYISALLISLSHYQSPKSVIMARG